MKKLKSLLIVATTILLFVSCGKEGTINTPKKVIKLGLNGEENSVWEGIRDKLALENIELKFVDFSDYVQPNFALSDKEIDANAFQSEIYFQNFKAEHKLDIISLGYTVLAPMGIYSSKIKNLSELKDGAKVAIPSEVSNGGRGLLLLQDAGFITLNPEVGAFATVKDIVSNPKKLRFVEIDSPQIPRIIQDVEIAAINNGVAVQAGYSPLHDSIFLEDATKERMKPYFNIIAVREENREKPELLRLVQLYQTEENKKAIQEFYKGSSIPAF